MWFGTLNNVFHRLLFSIYRQYNRIDNYYEQLFDIPLLVRCVDILYSKFYFIRLRAPVNSSLFDLKSPSTIEFHFKNHSSRYQKFSLIQTSNAWVHAFVTEQDFLILVNQRHAEFIKHYLLCYKSYYATNLVKQIL